MTKHQQILTFIEDLAIGSKVSVRFIAKALDVSEGTAYRAIKEAEAKGLVRSIPKVGTIRIEGVKERQIEDLTLREVSQIAEGVVICGFEYLDRSPINLSLLRWNWMLWDAIWKKRRYALLATVVMPRFLP